MTGQQKAAEQYLELLASARRGGPVDQLRWGSALARVSRLTEIPVEVLHRRFGKVEVKGQEKQENSAEKRDVARPSGSRYLAECHVLGVMLVDPKKWRDVQTKLVVESFEDPRIKALAEEYWHHQREEGEPVFNEFIASLKDAELKSL